MRICPKCGYHDPAIWRPAKMHNPSGDIDIARLTDVEVWLPRLHDKIVQVRGRDAVVEGIYAYYIGKRGTWVRRIAAHLYNSGGLSAFKPPYESSKHNPLANRVSGRTKTTFRKRVKK